MREDWTRTKPVLDLDEETLEGLIEPVFPGCHIVKVATVTGGLTNTNLRVWLAGRPGSLLVRFYQRGGDIAHKEMALAEKVKGHVRVPEYYHFAPENPVTGHAFAVVEWIEAEPLQDMVHRLNKDDLAGIGQAIGGALSGIHGFTYSHFAFLDGKLAIGDPMDLSGKGLVDYLRFCLVEGRGGPRIGPKLTDRVMAFAAREGARIDAWEKTACLVHGDFNLSNILVRRDEKRGWETAAVIDWEYAFSGAPGIDFGNVMRPPLDGAESFLTGLERGYRDAGETMPADWRRIARITDLFSYADDLHHAATSEAVVADAKREIEAIIAA
jgi:aminoglycoside phosphotransferase (APT) family kinase protein